MFLSEAQVEKVSYRGKFVSLQVNFFAAVVTCCCGNCLFQQRILQEKKTSVSYLNRFSVSRKSKSLLEMGPCPQSSFGEKEKYKCMWCVRARSAKWHRNSWRLCLKENKNCVWHSARHCRVHYIPKILEFLVATFRFSSQYCYRLHCRSEEHLIQSTRMVIYAFFLLFCLPFVYLYGSKVAHYQTYMHIPTQGDMF